jgi:hypothetical protein
MVDEFLGNLSDGALIILFWGVVFVGSLAVVSGVYGFYWLLRWYRSRPFSFTKKGE